VPTPDLDDAAGALAAYKGVGHSRIEAREPVLIEACGPRPTRDPAQVIRICFNYSHHLGKTGLGGDKVMVKGRVALRLNGCSIAIRDEKALLLDTEQGSEAEHQPP